MQSLEIYFTHGMRGLRGKWGGQGLTAFDRVEATEIFGIAPTGLGVVGALSQDGASLVLGS